VIPVDGVEQDVLRHVRTEFTVTITSSPSRGPNATLALAERLTARGYRVVPHLAARLISGGDHLRELLARIESLGIHEVFVVAGDIDEPLGPFAGAAALLETMAETGHGLEQIGITGYPESHPLISDETTIQAMFEKAPYATYIVSQICFDPAVIASWLHRVRARGVELPVYVGLPGPVDPARLLRLSTRIGLGESARFLRRHGSWLRRLTLPRGYRPGSLLERLGPDLAEPRNRVAGLHVFTFNELEQAEAWRRAEIERLGGLATPRGRPEIPPPGKTAMPG
jgi:methylenetetrahydrofolate reductase (NADPH)